MVNNSKHLSSYRDLFKLLSFNNRFGSFIKDNFILMQDNTEHHNVRDTRDHVHESII